MKTTRMSVKKEHAVRKEKSSEAIVGENLMKDKKRGDGQKERFKVRRWEFLGRKAERRCAERWVSGEGKARGGRGEEAKGRGLWRIVHQLM